MNGEGYKEQTERPDWQGYILMPSDAAAADLQQKEKLEDELRVGVTVVDHWISHKYFLGYRIACRPASQ